MVKLFNTETLCFRESLRVDDSIQYLKNLRIYIWNTKKMSVPYVFKLTLIP
jgi:hypothetical protein